MGEKRGGETLKCVGQLLMDGGRRQTHTHTHTHTNIYIYIFHNMSLCIRTCHKRGTIIQIMTSIENYGIIQQNLHLISRIGRTSQIKTVLTYWCKHLIRNRFENRVHYSPSNFKLIFERKLFIGIQLTIVTKDEKMQQLLQVKLT